MTVGKFDQLMDQLHDAMLHYYYVDHSKPKQLQKLILPEINNVDNCNKLMKLLNLQPSPYEQLKREQQKQQPMDKLTVHVNQQINIMPIVVAAPDSDGTESSGSGMYSENESEDAASVEPYSSSGFVESTESASSGIETSHFGSSTSTELDSDDEEEEEEGEEEEASAEENDDEEVDNEEEDDEESDGYSLSLTVESDYEDSDTEEHEANDDDDDVTLHNADNDPAGNDNDLASAQARWQRLFERQYQFIANYVDNYMETYRHQY